MGLFMVERYLVGWSEAEVQALVRRTGELAGVFETAGVRHVGSVYIPVDETCLCLFEAADAARVSAVNERCALPFGRVVAGELMAVLAQ